MGAEYVIGTIYFFEDIEKYLLAVLTNKGEEQLIGAHAHSNVFGDKRQFLIFNTTHPEIFGHYNPLDNDSTTVVGSVNSETCRSIDQTVLDWMPRLDKSMLMIDAIVYDNPITLILPPNFEKRYSCFKTTPFSTN